MSAVMIYVYVTNASPRAAAWKQSLLFLRVQKLHVEVPARASSSTSSRPRMVLALGGGAYASPQELSPELRRLQDGAIVCFLSSVLGLEKPLSPNEVERVGLLL